MKIAFITAPPEEANGLARRVVESGLAACVNVVFGVTSHYRWQGETHSDGEALLMAKLADENAELFVEKVKEWHSYQLPEVILSDVTGGNPDYLRWVQNPGGESAKPS